jgi:hypothetical protein
MLIPVKGAPGADYASLKLQADQEPRDPNWGYGILSVDNQDINGNGHQIYVARGKRSIYYTCPNFFVMDGSMKLVFKFTAVKNYLLRCDPDGHGSISEVATVGG